MATATPQQYTTAFWLFLTGGFLIIICIGIVLVCTPATNATPAQIVNGALWLIIGYAFLNIGILILLVSLLLYIIRAFFNK